LLPAPHTTANRFACGQRASNTERAPSAARVISVKPGVRRFWISHASSARTCAAE
jgi:hypothetical protein